MNRLYNEMAVSGYEEKLIECIRNYVEKYCDEIYVDAIGNLICYKKGTSSKAETQMIAAHVDEVGIQIQKIDNGKIYFKALGNIKCKNLLSQRIQFENGEIGIVYSNAESFGNHEYSKLYIQLLTNESKLEIGDIGTFQKNYLETEGFICSKAVDNRAGVACLVDLLTQGIECKLNTYFVFTVQEEIGLKGMQVAINHIKPDYFISLDASAINDHNNIELGKGVAIKVSDSISVCDRKLVQFAKKLCCSEHIKYQLEVSDCGTSEIALITQTEHGFHSIAFSYPSMEIHTAQSILKKEDYYNMAQLIEKWLQGFTV